MTNFDRATADLQPLVKDIRVKNRTFAKLLGQAFLFDQFSANRVFGFARNLEFLVCWLQVFPRISAIDM